MGLNVNDWYNLTKINRIIVPIACFILGMLTFSSFNIIKLLPIITIAFTYAGAATFNDMRDLSIDRVSNPKRPLVVHKITQMQAYAIITMFIVLGLALSYYVGVIFNKPFFIIFNFTWILLGILYSVFTSKYFISANGTLGISHGILPFLSAVYLFGTNQIFGHKSIVLMITIWIVLFLTYNIKDFKDIDGDRRGKRVTLPLLKDVKFAEQVMFGIFVSILPITVISRLLIGSTTYSSMIIPIMVSLGFIYLGKMLLAADRKGDFSLILETYRYLMFFYILSFLI